VARALKFQFVDKKANKKILFYHWALGWKHRQPVDGADDVWDARWAEEVSVAA
jgi:hypothetical protein